MDDQHNTAQKHPQYESDTKQIVRRHLSDPNHVITEEEIASIRIGRTPLLYPRPIEALYNSEDSMRGRAAGK
ncbi:MAG TPA: hypothetical protein VEY10_12065 [Flavisolibacter sp.]|jgi:hypothetical protein|nr:hypothetical protein [Flavisolibacter sp.]